MTPVSLIPSIVAYQGHSLNAAHVATLSQTQHMRVCGTVQNPTIRTRNGMKCMCMNEVMHKHSLGYIVIVLGKF